MPRAAPADLSDLRDELAEIRALPGLTERAPGVFWLGRVPFLHFHTRRPPRRAHAKNGATWGAEIILPVGAGRAARAAFVAEIRARYEAFLASQTRTRRRGEPTRRAPARQPRR